MWPFKKKESPEEIPDTEQESNDKDRGFEELGVAGVKMSGGYVYEEFLVKLQGSKGRKVYREMRDNDATISAIMHAIEMTIRGVEWNVIPSIIPADKNAPMTDDEQKAQDAADFLESVMFDDMSHTFDDFIAEVLSMLTFGWEYTEIVWKRRLGPNQLDPSKRSAYDDGYIGVRKLANRAQETLDKWQMDENGGIDGLWQYPPMSGGSRYIPIEKALLFRTTMLKNNPEGKSALRGSYVAWWYLKRIQEEEATGVERNLNGFPVIIAPKDVLDAQTPLNKRKRQAYIEMVRDMKNNSQGGAVIESDPWVIDGKATNMPRVDIKLLSTDGGSTIDTGAIILRYQHDIARTLAQDVMMLGSGSGGSWALSKDKSALSIRSIEGWLESIAATLNRFLVVRLWRINGFEQKYMPYLKPDQIADEDLEALGNFVSSLAKGGIMLNDPETEDELRAAANLPPKPDDMEDNISGDDMIDEKLTQNSEV
jgi:hypothetical protein